MSASQRRSFSTGHVASGLIAITISVLAVLLVSGRGAFPATYLEILTAHLTVGNVLLAAALAVLWQICGSFLGMDGGESEEDLCPAMGRLIARSLVLTLFLGACLAVFYHHSHALRSMFIFLCSASLCDLLRLALASRLTGRPNRVVIVGSNRLGAKAWREFRTQRRHRMELAGFVDQCFIDELLPDFAARYLGDLESLPRIVFEQEIDDVIVAIPVAQDDSAAQRAISLAGALGARILCLKDMCGIRPENVGRDYGDTFFELVPAPRLDGFSHSMKRASDLIIAALLLVMLLPVLAGVAVWGVVTGRPIRIHAEEKIGFRRKRYRTYRVGGTQGNSGLPIWLSHAPLIWSVLRGDMSLVGAAPLAEKELNLKGIETLAGSFNLRPGITGSLIPESAGRASSVRHDEGNDSTPSFGADMRTLVRTFRTLMRRTRVAETTVGAA